MHTSAEPALGVPLVMVRSWSHMGEKASCGPIIFTRGRKGSGTFFAYIVMCLFLFWDGRAMLWVIVAWKNFNQNTVKGKEKRFLTPLIPFNYLIRNGVLSIQNNELLLLKKAFGSVFVQYRVAGTLYLPRPSSLLLHALLLPPQWDVRGRPARKKRPWLMDVQDKAVVTPVEENPSAVYVLGISPSRKIIVRLLPYKRRLSGIDFMPVREGRITTIL